MGVSKYVGLLAALLPLINAAPTGSSPNLHPELLAAMKRDLGLDAGQATARVARELSAVDVIENLRTTAGASFAGAWVADNGNTINVGITDEALAAEVTAAGATPAIMANSASRLEEAKAKLDELVINKPNTAERVAAAPAEGVASWYVDVAANKVILEAIASGTTRAKELAAQIGLAESEFEVKTVQEMPSTFATIQGGVAYLIGGSARCSIGFTVTTGFVSAGHCGSTGARATTTSGASLGTFAGSVFPGSADMSYIRASSGNTLSGTINRYGQSTLSVSGSTVAAVGSSVCRSGSTTGVSCGTIQGTGATVNYSEGGVTGLTRTSVCAEPGDSGGSFYSGSQAQGVTSGGSGNCNTGGTTYFQPVNEILSTYGLTLVRG
ncbi:alpha-lytic protease prodomain-containing protein [Elsinoe australis]|uniref:Alpha-lytic protease prodomain-containing protein n=1 Tax=Elsinoe australis TaxID=40998 RepID=A0A4U7B3X7_9PEZI|nr:alpha-lytic protease prodomain-containing protein [Elsinoe australis]